MTNVPSTTSETRDGQRIAKVMARAGLCSRRDAEAWIVEGRVSVNGKVLESPAFNVSDDDDVRVDGVRLKEPERTRLFFFHKPRGLVTTARDPEGRATIFSALPPDLPRVVAIGRLDINTEGLLLLTNDGGLARVLELPATGWLRRYRVRAHGEVTQAQLDALRDGVTIEGVHYIGIEARLEREQGSNVWIMMGLREGKNREIKRVLEHLGLSVNRLIRVSFGPFELGELEEGAVAELNTRILRDQLGLKLAKQANANFDAPIDVRAPAAAATAEPVRDRRAAPARGDRPPFRPLEDKAAIAAELASRGERPEIKNPKKRKHVSILRAEARAEAAGPRMRVERGATADRKGREVKVERVSRAIREPEAPERSFRAAGKSAGGPPPPPPAPAPPPPPPPPARGENSPASAKARRRGRDVRSPAEPGATRRRARDVPRDRAASSPASATARPPARGARSGKRRDWPAVPARIGPRARVRSASFPESARARRPAKGVPPGKR
jgi:23S rRNA pseudouridine2605 synthase